MFQIFIVFHHFPSIFPFFTNPTKFSIHFGIGRRRKAPAQELNHIERGARDERDYHGLRDEHPREDKASVKELVQNQQGRSVEGQRHYLNFCYILIEFHINKNQFIFARFISFFFIF